MLLGSDVHATFVFSAMLARVCVFTLVNFELSILDTCEEFIFSGKNRSNSHDDFVDDYSEYKR